MFRSGLKLEFSYSLITVRTFILYVNFLDSLLYWCFKNNSFWRKRKSQAVFIDTSDINIVVKIYKAAQGVMCLAMAFSFCFNDYDSFSGVKKNCAKYLSSCIMPFTRVGCDEKNKSRSKSKVLCKINKVLICLLCINSHSPSLISPQGTTFR